MHDTNDRNGYDRDDYNHQNNFGDTSPNNKVDPKLGNTLDFYNDDMSRKAVGRLFDIPDDEDKNRTPEAPEHQTAGNLVKGFGDEREPADIGSRSNRYSSEGGSPSSSSSASADDDAFERPSGRRRRPGAISNAASQEPLNEDDLGFGLYRKRQPLGEPHREPEEPYRRPDSRRRPQITEDYDGGEFPEDRPPARTKPKEYKKIEPDREFDSPRSEPFPARRQKPGARPPARKPRFAVRREDEDEEGADRSYERGTPSMKMIIVGFSAFLGVLVLAIIVFQLISLGGQLAEAQAEAEVSAERLRQRNELAIENDRLTSDLAAAAAEIVRLESLLQVSPPAQPGDDTDTTPMQPYRTHTVQPGQTLGQIAEIFYGSAGQWRRIAEANRMSPPYHPHVGQILTIPD